MLYATHPGITHPYSNPSWHVYSKEIVTTVAGQRSSQLQSGCGGGGGVKANRSSSNMVHNWETSQGLGVGGQMWPGGGQDLVHIYGYVCHSEAAV